MPVRITIDGPSASGKTTLGHALAATLSMRILDTGLTFRAVAWIQHAWQTSVEDALNGLAGLLNPSPHSLPGITYRGEPITEHLFSPEIDSTISKLARSREAQGALRELHIDVASSYPIIAIGRDLARDVFPGAEAYYALVADEAARQLRREAQVRGTRNSSLVRPETDGDREIRRYVSVSPKGLVLDTTHTTSTQTFDRALRFWNMLTPGDSADSSGG